MARSKNCCGVLPSSGKIWHENIKYNFHKREGKITALQMQFHYHNKMLKYNLKMQLKNLI